MLKRDVKLSTLIGRGIRRRCPNCGGGHVFQGWFALKDRCPTCGYSFSREEGYWVSAIIVNTAVIEGLFLLLFIAIVIATAPDVEWVPLLVLGVVMNLVFPIFFYPMSKTVWMGIDLYFHPLEAGERPQERS